MLKKKGILLAGGSGTRLWPSTLSASKHLLPVYEKPMIYYSLSTMMLADVKEVLVICSPEHIDSYKLLLKNGEQWGISISYQIQIKPLGIAHSILISERFIDSEPFMLVLGDNLLFGNGVGRQLQSNFDDLGATIFACKVSNPQQFGVIDFDKNGNSINIIEKPTQFISDWAIPGVYFYDSTAVDRANKLKFSDRGELEITELNKSYLESGNLTVVKLGRGTAWLDLGSAEGLLDAGAFVRTVEERQNILIGSPDEIAFNNGWISENELIYNIGSYESSYAKKLKDLLIKK